ncbi:hypothetical protein BM536_034205 [Streptomyces phaeoluteigriseus]|uniref:PA14 domain-containing protein n=1 Tax=Streptomyces phaeoluteigriseus TaxID=114686 RepID=A0A1V6ML67_9ACTN|nr:hypothetical protein BM536_034205 [Streptomyces phaeoluteigriseus]
MGRPVPPQSRVRPPHRLLWPVTAAAGAALVAGTVQPPTPAQARPDVTPVASVTCSAGVWKADYYPNTTLTGTPRKSLCDASVNESWGRGHPAGISLPNDRFGVRWTMRRNFGGGGPFLLTTAAQDGVRVWIDGKRYVNLWRDYASTQRASVKVTVPAGTHTLRVDYAAVTGSANVAVSLAPTTPDRTAPLAPAAVKACAVTAGPPSAGPATPRPTWPVTGSTAPRAPPWRSTPPTGSVAPLRSPAARSPRPGCATAPGTGSPSPPWTAQATSPAPPPTSRPYPPTPPRRRPRTSWAPTATATSISTTTAWPTPRTTWARTT